MVKLKESFEFIIFGIFYIYNAPVLMIYLLVSAMGITNSKEGKELDKLSKFILLIIATLISTALYLTFPMFFFSGRE